ncbi:MAG: acyl carrier protein [Butyrivibrio sp.]|nr:acyl carrier protein [Butyrivibrio sp.]
MKEEMKFKSIVAQYCQVKPENMTGELRFREDLGFSSLDFMSMLGELEDEFDIELEEDKIINIHTIKEAMDMIKSLEVAV